MDFPGACYASAAQAVIPFRGHTRFSCNAENVQKSFNLVPMQCFQRLLILWFLSSSYKLCTGLVPPRPRTQNKFWKHALWCTPKGRVPGSSLPMQQEKWKAAAAIVVTEVVPGFPFMALTVNVKKALPHLPVSFSLKVVQLQVNAHIQWEHQQWLYNGDHNYHYA